MLQVILSLLGGKIYIIKQPSDIVYFNNAMLFFSLLCAGLRIFQFWKQNLAIWQWLGWGTCLLLWSKHIKSPFEKQLMQTDNWNLLFSDSCAIQCRGMCCSESPLQSCPPWVCMPAAEQTSLDLPPGWNPLWSSGTGPWCCYSGCTQSSVPSQPSTRTDAPGRHTH